MHFRIICLAFSLIATAIAQTSPTNNPIVQNGTQFEVRLVKTLDVMKVKVGETFTLRLMRETRAGVLQVPVEAKFQARILWVKTIPKRQKGESELAFIVERVTWKNVELPLSAFPVLFRRGVTASIVRATVPRSSFLQDQRSPTTAQSPESESPKLRTFPPEPSPRHGSTVPDHYFAPILPDIVPLPAPERGTVLRQKSNISLDSRTLMVIEQMP